MVVTLNPPTTPMVVTLNPPTSYLMPITSGQGGNHKSTYYYRFITSEPQQTWFHNIRNHNITKRFYNIMNLKKSNYGSITSRTTKINRFNNIWNLIELYQ